MGLELHGHGLDLRWVDPETGSALRTAVELAGYADEQEKRASQEQRRAKAAQAGEAAARSRAEAAEAEVARLREELQRLRPRS